MKRKAAREAEELKRREEEELKQKELEEKVVVNKTEELKK